MDLIDVRIRLQFLPLSGESETLSNSLRVWKKGVASLPILNMTGESLQPRPYNRKSNDLDYGWEGEA